MFPKNNASPVDAPEVLTGFFVLEGIDGAGTTTQLRNIEAKAREHHFSLRADCEPTPHPIGRLIRSMLRHEVEAHPATLATLFAADRRQHIDGKDGVRQVLREGSKVLCDRYLFSSLAYQSLDLPWEDVWNLNAVFPLPEVLFWFEVPVAEAQSRIDRRGQTRERFEDHPTQKRIDAAYRRAIEETEKLGLEIVRIDATLPIDTITDLIWSRICR